MVPPSPLPLFIVVPLALRFVGTRRRPNNVKGGGVGGPFLRVAQITSFEESVSTILSPIV